MKRWTVALTLVVFGAFLGSLATRSYLQSQGPQPPAMPRELTSYRDVVKRVLPAVVSIEARAKPGARDREELRKFFEDFSRAPETPNPGRLGFGSGFLVDPRGVILTNNHVVDGAGEVTVTLSDGRKFVSKEIRADSKTDIAIVRIETKEPLPFLEFGDSEAMEIGDRVLAVGAPFGLVGSVTHGIISGKDRSLRVNMYEDFLQTDAAINPGNSGGPLINLEGKVIGVNSAIKSRSGGFQGVGLAISGRLASDVMQKLLKDGAVKRGYLGVQIKDVDDAALAERLGLKDGQKGALVTTVYDGAPAAKAKVQEGDVVLSLDTRPIRNGRDLQTAVAGLPLNKPVKLALVRDGEPMIVEVVIEEQPEKFGTIRIPLPQAPPKIDSAIGLDKLGVEVTGLTPQIAEALGYRDSMKGAVVIEVKPGTPASQADLQRGMLITKVDRAAVTSAEELKAAVERASLEKGVLLQVHTPQGGANFVLVK